MKSIVKLGLVLWVGVLTCSQTLFGESIKSNQLNLLPGPPHGGGRFSFSAGLGVFPGHRYGYTPVFPYHGYIHGPGYYRIGYPHVGLFFDFLPFGYTPFLFNGYWYYYYDGVFYQPFQNNYKVVNAPLGAIVYELPTYYKVIKINDQKYFVADGVFYKKIMDSQGKKGYQICGINGNLNSNTPVNVPTFQMGDKFNQIPENSHKVILNNKIYWVSPDGNYYEEIKEGSSVFYRLVGKTNPSN